MTYRLEDFDPDVLKQFTPQSMQAEEVAWLGNLDEIQFPGMKAFSGFKGDRLIGCSGLFPIWPGRWQAWAVYSLDVGRYEMLKIYRWTRDFLDAHRYRRVETTVLTDFEAGHKFATMLKFKKEGILRAYDPAGRDHTMYSRVS